MFDLTDEQRMIVTTLRDIAENRFEKTASDWGGEVPRENLEILVEQGFYGINFDEEHGGGGITEFEALLATEVIGRTCPITAWHYVAQHFLAPRAIEDFGSDAVVERYLPGVIEGDELIATAMSEPEAGSDLKAMQTTVEERDGELVLNGEKIWISNAPDSSAMVVWTRFPEGMGTVVVDLDADGVEFTTNFTNMADETQSQVHMDDVVVPEENVLTRGEEAFQEQLRALNWERLGSAALYNGTALCALDKALDYAGDRVQFDQPIGDFQGIEWKLAQMVTDLQAARHLTLQAGTTAVAQGRIPDPMATLMAKLKASQVSNAVVDEALQIHGANGYQQGHDLEFLYRLARGYPIAGGTDEIQKNQIARFLKKEGVPDLA